ncbi:MAG: serine hydrolase domain-containing protein [Hellea sp.]
MFRWIAFWMVILISSFSYAAVAKDFDTANFETFTKDIMAASNIPGLAVVIFDENGTVYEKAFGIADADKTPVTLDTPFQLGSVSKSFAALVLVQLASEGRVDLDAPVINYLPKFRTADKNVWKDITLQHVLSHRSGISTFNGNRMQRDIYRGTDALDIAIGQLRKTKLVLKPGSQLQYSNANYMLAAAVVEVVTKQSYETVVDERIFKPLAMQNSYVQMPLRESVKEASGFRQWFGIPIAHTFIPGRAMMGAGGVTSSARDLAIYVRAVAAKDPSIIPSEFADYIITPQGHETEKEGYGLGWMLIDVDNKKVVYHAGLNAGFTAQAGFIEGDRRGGLVLANSSGGLQADVAGVVLRKGLEIPTGPSRPSIGQHMTV